jgi:hypothetical protein
MSPRLVGLIVLAFAIVAAAGYGFGLRDSPAGASAQEGSGTWNSTMVWRPTLEEAGIGLAEIVNQIDASCDVDVDPVLPTEDDAPEGPVYAFAITWRC